MSVETIDQPEREKTAATQKNLITGEQFYRMTGIGPAELVRGEIVTHMQKVS